MTSRLVLDTSVVLKWVRQEEILAAQALGLLQQYLDGQCRVIVPSLLAYEVANVLRYKADLNTTHVETAIQSLFDLGLEWTSPTASLTRRAACIARDHETSVYDATFAALAESVNGTLITADERLVHRLTALPYVTFLGNVVLSA